MKRHLLFTSLLLVMALCLASCNKTVVVPDNYCEELVNLAEEGNAEAQAKLGKCYLEGDSVELSYPEAVEWLTKAANQGNADAQVDLAECYLLGFGVEQSNERAIELFKKSAEQGNAVAQCELGLDYLTGKGVEKSTEKGLELLEKSVEQGNPNAQAGLGLCYLNGVGVEQSYSKAVELFQQALGESDVAKYNLGICYLNGYGVEKNFDEGLKLILEAAKGGYASAKAYYGLYCFSRGDYESATGWLANAAILGDATGIEAINTWIKQRAKNGSAEAQYWMGRYCESKNQNKKAIRWYTLATNQGHADAPKALQTLHAKLQKSK